MLGTDRSGTATAYASIREQVKDGDLLLFQGRGWLSRVINRVTGKAQSTRRSYSHSGIAMWWHPPVVPRSRLMVFQAVGRGVEVQPASRAVDRYSGHVDWFPLTDEARSRLDVDRLFTFCLEHLGAKYSVLGLVSYLWHRIIGDLEGARERQSPRKMFCSWYVSHVFTEAGLDPDVRHPSHFTAPNDLADSDYTVYGGTLHHDREAEAAGARDAHA
ncbi:MAG: hypothetical protein D6689_16400 [Deltaproteobacteria bacterium]|nr:MAG: hypothetical protein D6689_16400 [Deltaproteobacteria bacterium]